MARSCPTRCAFDTDCVVGAFCNLAADPPVCQLVGALGTLCSSADECESGVCTDGVCCSSACDGSCEQCDIAGSEGTCSPAPAGTDGGCAPKLCDGVSRACLEGCTPESCADGFICDVAHGLCTDGPICSDDTTLAAPDGNSTDCAPYLCADRRCTTTCTTSAACAPGYVCDAHGTCTDEPIAVQNDGCSCRVVGASDGEDETWVLVLLLGVMLRRRATKGGSK